MCWIASDEVLQQPRHLRRLDRVVYGADEVGEGENLPLADQLLVEIRVEELDFIGHRARHVTLLDAFGVRQLLLAQLQNLAVVEPQRKHADEQHSSQHYPENARATEEGVFDRLRSSWPGGHRHSILGVAHGSGEGPRQGPMADVLTGRSAGSYSSGSFLGLPMRKRGSVPDRSRLIFAR